MTRLEQLIGFVLRAGVLTSSALLAAGLLLSVAASETQLSRFLLQAGIVILLCTPVARVVVSVVEYIVDRDWTFATLTLIVLAELLVSVLAAVFFNRRV